MKRENKKCKIAQYAIIYHCNDDDFVSQPRNRAVDLELLCGVFNGEENLSNYLEKCGNLT